MIDLIWTWETLVSGILSGLIAGLLTYFGVLLTLRNQSKTEYPKKLNEITKIAFDLREYEHHLGWYIYTLEQGRKYDNIEKLKLTDFREKLILKATNTDKETYRAIINALNSYSDKGYVRILVPNVTNREEVIRVAKMFREDLNFLQQEIDKRVKHYEKKLK